MRGEINPKYKELESFLKELPANFDHSGELIYEGRNTIRTFYVKGYLLNVKSFKIPHLINKIAYAWLRGSKAKHSYLYAMKLIKKGASTPEPVACVEVLKN